MAIQILSLALLGPTLLPPTSIGDASVPNFQTRPLDVNTQAAVDAGLTALAAYDPVAASEITDAVMNGSLDVVELTNKNRSGFKGASDGNTICVRLSDGVSAQAVAVRMRHEWHHWKYGESSATYNGGVLDACGEFQNWADTYDHICYVSCEVPGSITCNSVVNAAAKLGQYYIMCLDMGGAPIWPPNPPPCCCD